MKVVYLGHPYGGDDRNAEDAKQIVLQLIKKFPGTVFISPLQATGFYYNDIPYIEGMDHCLELLSRADELWLCDDYKGESWHDSKGCMMEYAFAKAKGMPIKEDLSGYLLTCDIIPEIEISCPSVEIQERTNGKKKVICDTYIPIKNPVAIVRLKGIDGTFCVSYRDSHHTEFIEC